MSAATVLSIHIGKAEKQEGFAHLTAIRKIAHPGLVALGSLGLEGDMQIDTRHHGGPERALCAVSSEDYPLWIAHTGHEMPLGSFGENLALKGAPDTDVCIGDIYRIGDCRVQVTCPRGPCGTLSRHWNCNTLAKYVLQQRKTGFYMSVLTGGHIAGGMPFALEARPFPAWNIPRVWDVVDVKDSARADRQELLAVPMLGEDFKVKLRKLLEKN